MTTNASADAGAEATLMGGWPALLVAAAVMVGAYFAFSHRPQPPFPATQLFAERLHVNAVTQAGKRLVAVGEQGRVLVSDDEGTSWREARVEPQRGSTLTQVQALGGGVLLAVGHDGWIVRSADNGNTWKEAAFNTPAPAGTGVGIGPDPFAASDEEAAAPDGSAAAAPAEPVESAPAQSDPLMGIAGPFGDKLFAFGAFGLFLVSTDAGATWTREFHDAIGDRHLNAMVGAGDGALIVVGERGLLARSADLGATWSLLPEIYRGSFYGALLTPDGRIVAYGMRGNVFHSSDHGSTWSQSEVPVAQSLFGGTLGGKGEVILAGANNTILVSTDGGLRFAPVGEKDRRGLAAVLPLANGQWVTVGDGGIRVQRSAR